MAFSSVTKLNSGLHSAALRVQRWVSSDGLTNWFDHTPPALQADDAETRHVIEVDPSALAQVIDGFGGCFNERGWDSLDALPTATREQALKDLFSPEGDGCRFNLARTPIGASDYAMDWYSLADTRDDYELKNFSLDRDRKLLIPFIKAAQRHNPSLAIWGSPWCPPAWMKINGRYDHKGGVEICHIKQDACTLETYARYFGLYIREYQKEGIPIYAIHVQNEPASGQVFPSCEWSGEEMLHFIKHHLAPCFDREGIKAEIWLGTINHGDVRAYASKVFADPATRERVVGIGYQWDGKHAIGDASALFPEKKLMQTESECGTGSNDKAAGMYTYSLLVHYLKRGANSYLYWNMVLDRGGYSTWSWQQNSLLTVERAKTLVSYNFEYHVMRHFSRFVHAGAHRLITKGKDEHSLAFLNPDGTIVVVVQNPRYTPLDLRLRLGSRMVRVTLPQETLHTFVLSAV